MSIDCNDFMAISRNLLVQTSEIGHRTASSRAYYCAYHTCLNLADTLGIDVRKSLRAGSHEKLIDSLKANNLPSPLRDKVRRIGVRLEDLKRDRVRADYLLKTNFRFPRAQNAIELAGLIVRDAGAISVAP